MKSVSVTDLKLIPELSHLNYFEMIDPKNDHLVNPFLEIMGMDLDYPLQYVAKQHRNLQNKVVINYMIIGETNINREHITGPWGSLTDRMIAAAYQDPSLCKELGSHLNTSLDYNAFKGGRDQPDEQPSTADFPTTDEERMITAQIKQLEELLLHIRGDQRREDGGYKYPHEYSVKKEDNT